MRFQNRRHTLKQIRLLIEMMRICKHCPTDQQRQQDEPPRSHWEPPRIKGEPPMLLTFHTMIRIRIRLLVLHGSQHSLSLSRNFFLQPLYHQFYVLKSTLLHQILLCRIRVKILHFSRSVYQYLVAQWTGVSGQLLFRPFPLLPKTNTIFFYL
jgi:hypothetical protein